MKRKYLLAIQKLNNTGRFFIRRLDIRKFFILRKENNIHKE